MKHILYALLLLGSSMACAQTTSQNYIKETQYTYRDAFPTTNTTSNFVTTVYYDGLGRPVQEIQQNMSPVESRNIVTHIEYDKNTGQTKSFLPFTASGTEMQGKPPFQISVPHSNFVTDARQLTLNLYNTAKYGNTANPYSQNLLEASPRQRVLETAAPGAAWAMDNPEKHTIRYQYNLNEKIDILTRPVKKYKTTTSWDAAKGLYTNTLVQDGIYPASTLFKTTVKNENWKNTDGVNNTTEEFKDHKGNVVLKRTYNNGDLHDTYYVYDLYNNLAYVLPPLANGGIDTTTLNGLCYQYRYDERNRLVEKKLPGKDWEYIVYDQADRIVMTGPVLSPFGSEAKGWLFTKYDGMDRVVYTGYYNMHAPTSANRKVLKDLVYGQTQLNEAKTSSNGAINGVTVRYSNTVFPTAGVYPLTVNYYDNYEFPGALASFPAIEGVTPVTAVKGLVTGNWVRVSTTSSEYKASVSYTLYNTKYQPIRHFTQNHLGGYTQTDSKLTFRGVATKTTTKHKRTAAASELTIIDNYTYDNRERLTKHTQQIGNAPEELIAQNTYDELGVLESKKVGGLTSAANPLQDVSYKYNVRGWLTEMNTLDSSMVFGDDRLYNYAINYTGTFPGDTSQAQYNGNIASIAWRTLTDNVIRGYGYDYDYLNRLNYGSHLKVSGRVIKNYNRDGQYAEDLTYDKNGNIQTLKRFGKEEAGQPIEMDELSYTYQGNQLLSVTDTTNNPEGFNDANTTGNDYTYDVYGNLKTDKNKGITAIAYNHLNLPVQITFTGGTMGYTYDATGTRVAKTVTPTGGSAQTTDYLGGFQYLNNVLQFFHQPEGFVAYTNNQYLYHYIYKDHLGNNRLTYTDSNKDGVIQPASEIVEENNYYPFGLQHKGYNELASSEPSGFNYKFGGKELNEELGLNVYDFGARNYDPALGRWMNIDPLAEQMRRFSPYNYAFNNPVVFVDPDGMAPWGFDSYGRDLAKSGAIASWSTGNDYWDGFVTPDDGGGKGFWKKVKSFFGINSNEKPDNSQYTNDGSTILDEMIIDFSKEKLSADWKRIKENTGWNHLKGWADKYKFDLTGGTGGIRFLGFGSDNTEGKGEINGKMKSVKVSDMSTYSFRDPQGIEKAVSAFMESVKTGVSILEDDNVNKGLQKIERTLFNGNIDSMNIKLTPKQNKLFNDYQTGKGQKFRDSLKGEYYYNYSR